MWSSTSLLPPAHTNHNSWLWFFLIQICFSQFIHETENSSFLPPTREEGGIQEFLSSGRPTDKEVTTGKRTQIVRCQPRVGDLQRWNKDNTETQGLLLSQAQCVQLRHVVFKQQKAHCMPNPFETLVKEMLLLKTSPSAGKGLSYKSGPSCSIELDLWHKASLLQYTYKTCQNRKVKIDPGGPFRAAFWRQGMEGHCFLTPQHEALAHLGVCAHWTGHADIVSWY